MRTSGWLCVGLCVLGASTTGCLERKGAPVGPNVSFAQEVSIAGGGVTEVDVMFVIDNSGSMSQEQTNLAIQIPALVEDLASPPDRDGDGAPDWNPVESLRIGIVTTDVGTGVVSYTGSHCVDGGEDGMLRDGVFEWSPDSGETPDAFADRVKTTVEGLGITGCAFEQPLEAAARAVARADATGFPGSEGLFALIVVTDEEDCSVEDDSTFFATLEPGTANVMCTRREAELTPVSQLLTQIRGSRAEDDFIFAAITGVPRDLPAEITPAEILARSDMMFTEYDGSLGLQNREVCEAFGDDGRSLGQAYPARRIVQFADLVGDSVLTTICTDDFGPAVDEIGGRIGSRVPGVCLVRALPAGGVVPCEIEVTLQEGTCEAIPGYTLLRTSEEGLPVCGMAQVSPDSGEQGFYYDPDHQVTETSSCAQLVITEGALPPIGAAVDAFCNFDITRGDGEQCARATQCASGYCDPVGRVCAPLPEADPTSDPPTGS